MYKVGSAVRADLSRLKRQFPQLSDTETFKLIDLKEFCIQQGVINRDQGGSLDVLLKKAAHKYISKDPNLRRCEDWEISPLRNDLVEYAALDAYASRVVYEEAAKLTPPLQVSTETQPGTRVTLFTQADSGIPAAHGTIADPQPQTHNRIRVKMPAKSRLLLNIDQVIVPAAAATLHLLPGNRKGRNKAGTWTLGELQQKSIQPNGVFQLVAPVSHLRFYEEPVVAEKAIRTNVVCSGLW